MRFRANSARRSNVSYGTCELYAIFRYVGLTAFPRPEQNCKNDQPDDAPADPRGVRVGRLPFEDFLMDGH